MVLQHLFLVNAQSITHIVFQLYDVLRFDSTIVINVLINILYHPQSSTTNFFFLFPSRRHKCASALTSAPKAELLCSFKCRKFIGQNKVKICNLLSQNFKFLSQKICCPTCYS